MRKLYAAKCVILYDGYTHEVLVEIDEEALAWYLMNRAVRAKELVHRKLGEQQVARVAGGLATARVLNRKRAPKK